MNLEYFPHFAYKNYPVLKGEPEETIMELGREFKKYLEEKFKDKMDKLAPIWNIDAKTVIMKQVQRDPFSVNGYHPALILHFEQWFKEMAKQAREIENKD